MENLELLNKILLSANVTENFHKHYAQNEEFKTWLLGILPQVEDCKNQEQNNPWHKYNVLDHILHSVEEMNKQTINLNSNVRRMLAYTMFLHDIGKPDCLIRRFSKQYNREVDSFFNHNKASVRISKRVLKDFGFNTNEQKIILELVDKHDIFMFLTITDDGNKYHKVLTHNLINDEIEEFNKLGNGAELLNYLIMVGRSDNKAQNPEMTANSLKLLDIMQSMLNEITLNACKNNNA